MKNNNSSPPAISFGDLLAIELYNDNSTRGWRLGMVVSIASKKEKLSVGIKRKETLYKVIWFRPPSSPNHPCYYTHNTILLLRNKFLTVRRQQEI